MMRRKIERYTYTADGLMLSMHDRNGNTTNFVYDAQSRLISKTVEGEQASKAKLNERQVK
ncbi:RHS repeat domain-containing protein, partial [Paenibacillus sp. NEAU-GSW1]|uniref:RHS repeat domain-containing protein n=1 Tax=Paenibacillus sp. NEAU-GSW1 TaxID=2682486 RepID=UPI001C12B00E